MSPKDLKHMFANGRDLSVDGIRIPCRRRFPGSHCQILGRGSGQMKKQQTFLAESYLIQERPDIINAVSTSPAPLDMVAIVIPTRDYRHDARTRFKRLQDMFGLKTPRARDDDLLKRTWPVEIRHNRPGAAG